MHLSEGDFDDNGDKVGNLLMDIVVVQINVKHVATFKFLKSLSKAHITKSKVEIWNIISMHLTHWLHQKLAIMKMQVHDHIRTHIFNSTSSLTFTLILLPIHDQCPYWSRTQIGYRARFHSSNFHMLYFPPTMNTWSCWTVWWGRCTVGDRGSLSGECWHGFRS